MTISGTIKALEYWISSASNAACIQEMQRFAAERSQAEARRRAIEEMEKAKANGNFSDVIEGECRVIDDVKQIGTAGES